MTQPNKINIIWGAIMDQMGDHFLVAHLKIVKLAGQIQVLVQYWCKYDGTLDYIATT